MKRIVVILTGIVALICSQQATAQYNPQQPPILPQAPSTAALGKFGDYQVSHFTGIPSISIPIHTIKTNGFEIPITLMYHASGLKVYQYPSWVGSGWALSAGGQIRRQLTGIADELAGIGSLAGEPLKTTQIDLGDPDDRDYLKLVNEGQRDNGADIFSYNFLGYDGNFFFDRDSGYKIMKIPYSPIRIKNSGSTGQLNFDITDEKGNRYEFGKSVTESSALSGGGAYYVSSYMLEKMTAATVKDTISFTYHEQFERSPIERTDNWVVEDQINHGSPKFTEFNNELPFPYNSSEGTFSSTNFQSETFSKNTKEIKFKNGKIIFELDTQTREDFNMSGLSNKALKQIKIINTAASGADTLLKTIVFYHGYFTNGSNDSKRLRLDSIAIFDKNNVKVGRYRFEYNTTINLPAPGVSMLSKDYWGYYNGRSNTCLIPQTTIEFQPLEGGSISDVTIGSTNAVGREPDSTYVQANILKRIYYPTSGYTDFEYQSNRYLDDSSNMKLAGGLRIKSIKSYDSATSTPVVRTYKYGIAESGYGRKNFFGEQQYYFEEQRFENWDRNEADMFSNPHLIDEKRRRVYYDNPTTGVESFDGASVVYPVVTEYLDDGSSVLGKTIYQYRDSTDGIAYSDIYSSKPIVSTRFFSRGQLSSKKVYKQVSTNTYHPVTEDLYTYNTSSFSFSNRYVGLSMKQRIVREPIDNYTGSHTPYDYYYTDFSRQSDDSYPISNTAIRYNPLDSTKNITTISWNSYANYLHQQPNFITTIDSKGDTIISILKYPADYIPTNDSIAHQSVLDTMLKRNMQVYPVELWTKKKSGDMTLSGGLNLYKQLSGGGLVVLDNQKRLEIPTQISNYSPASIVSGSIQSDSRYKTMLNFPVYESNGNINEVQKENDEKDVYLWGYKGAYPVAKIAGSTYSAASALITQSVLDNPANDYELRNHLNVLRTGLSQAFVSTYTYIPGVGVTSETDARGVTTYYAYDNLGRLSIVKDRDGKILKKICYNYFGQAENCDCISTSATWVNTSTATRCKKNGSNENTGQIEQEQVDTNPCSSTFNQLQWVVTGTNYGTCPLPCNSSTCSGNDKKCVSGVCETGVRINVGSDYDFEQNTWICYYRYEFSDSSVSDIFSEYTLGPCYFN